MMILFVVTIIAAITLTGSVLYDRTNRSNREHILEGDRWLVHQTSESVAYTTETAESLSNEIAFDPDIQSAMIRYTYYNEGQTLPQVRTRLNTLLQNKGRYTSGLRSCVNLIFFSKEGEAIGFLNRLSQKITLDHYTWADQLRSSKGKNIWLPLSSDRIVGGNVSGTARLLPIARKVYSVQSTYSGSLKDAMTVGRPLGYLVIFFDADMFSDIIATDTSQQSKQLLVVDGNNRIISSTLGEGTGSKFSFKKQKNGNILYSDNEYVMTAELIADRGWECICLTSAEETRRDGRIVISICLVLCLILLLIFIFVGGLLSRAVLVPIQVLMGGFGKAMDGDVEIAETSSISEFSSLYQSFNRTMKHIHSLANQVYRDKIIHQELVMSNKESQIRALMQQINPHFLYNTLDSINWKARQNGDRETAEMITLLGKFFRSNISRKDDFTTLADEIENIRLYIAVSKMRFGDRLDCSIQSDGVDGQTRIMKLLLQPLVENAIRHGLEVEAIREEITLYFTSDDGDLIISVKDNGPGMEKEDLAYIRELWDTMDETYRETRSVGLYNVMRRLYLYYQEDADFQVFSEKGKGTEFVLTFPMKESGKIEN